MGLLILICLLALIHWGLKSIAIRIPPLHNSPIIRRFSPNSFNNLPQAQNVHINWPQLYPFDNSTKTPSKRIHYFPKPHNHTPAEVSVKFSSVIHLTVDDYYLRGFGFISISV